VVFDGRDDFVMVETLIEAVHDDVFITDGEGNVLEVSRTFAKT
jgi:hypothetical protein